jgi:hypothetical protein
MKINLYLLLSILLILIGIIIYKNIYKIKITFLTFIVILRGILAPNCFWWKISDLLLKDSAGVELYKQYKKDKGDFALTKMYGKKVYIVTNNKYRKIILDNSPHLFKVGELKKKFFKSFMKHNVGVSTGCPWQNRRHLNEIVLTTDKLHLFSKKYNNDTKKVLMKYKPIILDHLYFKNIGKNITKKVIFNCNKVHDDVFNIFNEANSIIPLINDNFKINQTIYNNYINTLKKHINNPKKNSLFELCLYSTKDETEIIHQIPHFIFPIVGLYITTIPRLLLLLCNHPVDFKIIIDEIYSINEHHQAIYKLPYLRSCILETLRLNNPVTTTFRTLSKDFSFDKNNHFKKNDQFLILNNAVLRENEYWKLPNSFIPSRWNYNNEQSYYALSFNQGPQKCPGKELAIFLTQSFIYHFIKINKIGRKNTITSNKIDTDNIKGAINSCDIIFNIKSIQ